ncbi:MAG: HAD family phosphatase [Polyangiaceae bacterium]|nr:HAD family phosphatase [Polyangiaceae bacterium]
MVLLWDVMDTLVYDPFNREIPAYFGLTREELLAQKHGGAWIELEHGRLTPDEYLRTMFTDRRPIDAARFERHVRESYRFMDGVEALLEELHEQGVEMHALSNYPVWYRWIEEELEVSRFVKWSFVSCTTGYRKPEPEAYAHAARVLGRDPAQCIFIDDRQKNCDGAAAVGMAAIHFESAEQVRRQLAAYGIG